MIAAVRLLAVAIAIAGLVDPALATRRPQPLAVDIRAGTFAEAVSVGQRLAANLKGHVVINTGLPPEAIVAVGQSVPAAAVPDDVPISVVSWSDASRPNVRVLDVTAPGTVLPGQETLVSAAFDGIAVAGLTTTFALERNTVQIAHLDHRWSGARERFVAEFRYAPPVTGIESLRVVARPLGGEYIDADNGADVGVTVRSRLLRIAIYDARPSWAITFVRRALESDPLFEVSSLVRASRGLEVRSGPVLAGLTRTAIAPYDAVLVGAPEALTTGEVDTLDAFARERGGAVVLLPDRPPEGPYAAALVPGRFDAVLLEQPLSLDEPRPSGLYASELAMASDAGRGASVLGAVLHAGARKPVIVSWPRGAGRILFSGALDGWRYRARDDDGFGRFWTGTVANLALAAPPPLSVQIEPALAAPGEAVTIRAAFRTSELDRASRPGLSAALIAADGSKDMVRLWPAAEPGVFEAVLNAPTVGRYDLRVSAGSGAVADTPLFVEEHVRRPWLDDESARLLAKATGGVSVEASDLAPLEAHLRARQRQTVAVTVHPMRSWGWAAAFAALLCAEWSARRRQGRR